MAEAVDDNAPEEVPQEPTVDEAGAEAPADSGEAPSALVVDTEVPETPVTTVFPEDWREQLAGEDEKLLNVLKRFTTPQNLAKSFNDTRNAIRSGVYKRQLGSDASEEDIKAWREEAGIPESPDKYELDLAGRVLPEGDEETVQSFLEVAHEHNFPTEYVNEAVRWYADLVENETASQIEADTEYKMAAVDELRAEWGHEYRSNINAIKNWLGDDMGSLILNARGEDGQILGNNPAVLMQFAQWARDANPAATLTGIGTPDLTGVEERISQIEAEMKKGDGSEYYRGAKDENGNTKMQNEYRRLVEARERMKG